MSIRLDRLLRPKSIAVIGGGFFAPNVIKQSLKMGFAGDIWAVHPSKDEVAGVRAYKSLAELPGAPDASFIGVNRKLTIEVVRELRERGAGARSASRPASARPAATMPMARGCRRS